MDLQTHTCLVKYLNTCLYNDFYLLQFSIFWVNLINNATNEDDTSYRDLYQCIALTMSSLTEATGTRHSL